MNPVLRVLAVDDSAAIRHILRSILQAAGHEVATAGGVASGLRILKSLQPDVILTDFNMPGLTGHDFVSRIRADRRFAAVPVFVVSSEQAVETRMLMDAAGANGWIAKPISPADLLAVVEAVRRSSPVCAGRTARPVARPALTAGVGHQRDLKGPR